MTARASSINAVLAQQVRDVQDLVNSDRAMSAQLTFLEGVTQPDQSELTARRKELARIEEELRTRQAELKQAFPKYVSLVDLTPIGVRDTQKVLRDNEALVKFFLPSSPAKNSKGFVWAITKAGS